MPPSDPQPQSGDLPAAPSRRRRAGRLVWLALAVSVRAALLLAIGVCALSPRLIGFDWRFDLVATLLAQIALAAFILTAWQAAFRRWVWTALFAVGAAGCFSWMLTVERATFESTVPEEGRTVLRVLEMNIFSRNTRSEELLQLISRHQPDIVVVLESSTDLLSTIRNRPEVLEEYPYTSGLHHRVPGQILVISSLPLLKTPASEGPVGLDKSWGYLAGFVAVDGSLVRFAAVHAASPRTRATWAFGQNTFDRLGAFYDRLGSPVSSAARSTIVVGDLNCSPTSARSRQITDELGLVRAKPLRRWDGTFPSKAPWFARTAIDGAMVSPDVLIHRWETVGLPGSDHRGVLLEMSIDPEG